MPRLWTLALLLALPAWAARRRAPAPEPAPPVPTSAPAAPEAWSGTLFPPTVIVDPGAVPTGVAHLGAQACAACHPRSHDDWAGGAHARAPTPAHEAAAVGLAGCDACHRPLLPQRPTIDTVWDGRLDAATSTANPAFDAGLWREGVTCAACHVREGVVLTADPAAAGHPSPHPLRYAPALADGTACAACHQLSVPGGVALYDTWGESERAGFVGAGVTCLTCHGRAGADPGFVDHDPTRPLAHGLSVGLSVPALRVVRGAEPVVATVRLQNTGAGHAVPTGSPWRRVEVRAFLLGPPDKSGARPRRGEVVEVLGRTIDPAPPFAVTADTRLLPGASRDVPVPLALPADTPAVGWELVVQVGVPGDPDPRGPFERRWPLSVE